MSNNDPILNNLTEDDLLDILSGQIDREDISNFILTNLFFEYVIIQNINIPQADQELIAVLKFLKKHAPHLCQNDEFVYRLLTDFKFVMREIFSYHNYSTTDVEELIKLDEEEEKKYMQTLRKIRNAEKRAIIREVFVNDEGEILPLEDISEITGLNIDVIKPILNTLIHEEVILS